MGARATLVARNVTIENDPVFSVAIMLHTRKFKEYHTNFLQKVLDELNVANLSNLPVICDRERGIVEALKSLECNFKLVYCGKHILRDVKAWVKKHGGKADDVKVLRDHTERIRDGSSNGEFNKLVKKFETLWSQSFENIFTSICIKT